MGGMSQQGRRDWGVEAGRWGEKERKTGGRSWITPGAVQRVIAFTTPAGTLAGALWWGVVEMG